MPVHGRDSLNKRKSMRILARHYHTAQPVAVTMDRSSTITSVTPCSESELPDPGLFVAPGWFDLPVNGYAGKWFSDESLTITQVAEILAEYRVHGMTRVMPTVITNREEALAHGLSVLRQACDSDASLAAQIAGIHLEGPFLSPQDGPRGAHAREWIRPCDGQEFDRLQHAAGGRIRIVTIAPESPGAVEFVRRVRAQGVHVSIGHTAANSAQIAAVVEAGARLATHLGNGCALLLPRHPNTLWDQLAEPRLTAGLITDGFHIPRNFGRTVFRTKGAENLYLTSDVSGFGGLAAGDHWYQGRRFEVLPEGRVVTADPPNPAGERLLAGSMSLLDDCVARAPALLGCSLSQACDMASRIPSQILSLPPAQLTTGAPADLVIFEPQENPTRMRVSQVITA